MTYDPFDNATLHRANEALEQAKGILAMAEATRQETMRLTSVALWCDISQHAFSAKDKGKRGITMTRWDEDKGQDVEDLVMSCGPCAQVNPLIQAAQPDKPVPAAAIGAPAGRYNPDYTARLQREADAAAQSEWPNTKP